MAELWWKLPILRRFSPLRRGLAEAVAVVGFGSLLLFPAALRLAPSAETCGDMAQIGASLLIAYAIETSWWLKASRIRGSGRENWVGGVIGVGLAGFVGIAVALALSAHSGSLGAWQALGFAWSILSLVLLGVLVAMLPLLIYEWTHDPQADYPDE